MVEACWKSIALAPSKCHEDLGLVSTSFFKGHSVSLLTQPFKERGDRSWRRRSETKGQRRSCWERNSIRLLRLGDTQQNSFTNVLPFYCQKPIGKCMTNISGIGGVCVDDWSGCCILSKAFIHSSHHLLERNTFLTLNTVCPASIEKAAKWERAVSDECLRGFGSTRKSMIRSSCLQSLGMICLICLFVSIAVMIDIP